MKKVAFFFKKRRQDMLQYCPFQCILAATCVLVEQSDWLVSRHTASLTDGGQWSQPRDQALTAHRVCKLTAGFPDRNIQMSPGNLIFMYWDKTKIKERALAREVETGRYEKWFLCGLHQQCSCGVGNYILKIICFLRPLSELDRQGKD